MEVKTGIYIAVGAFVAGAAIGSAITRNVTKNECEKRMQESVDDINTYYRKKLKELKKQKEENDANEKGEEVKPSFVEVSSLHNSDNSNNSVHSKYNYSDLKAAIKKTNEEKEEDEEPEEIFEESSEEQKVIDYKKFLALTSDDSTRKYLKKDFTFSVDEEVWRDYDSDANYDEDELPFNVDLVEWDKNGQCYIVDKSNYSVYILEKV